MYKLLLVDDEILTCETIKNFIPWQVNQIEDVYIATNGVQALEIFEKHQPDIVVCDIRMPYMNGIEFVQKLREDNNNCPVIFISGFADVDYLKSAIDVKASGFIEKPFLPNDVLEAVKKAINELEDKKRKTNFSHLDKLNYTKFESVKKIILQEDNWKNSAQVLSEVECDPFYLGYVAVVSATIAWVSIILPQQKSIMLNSIVQKINTSKNLKNISAALITDSNICILLPVSSEDNESILSATQDLTCELAALCKVKIEVKYACGKAIQKVEDIKNSYNFSMSALNNQFYKQDESISFSYDSGIFYEPSISLYSKYREILNNNDFSKLNAFYESLLFEILDYKDSRINIIKNIFFNLIIILTDYSNRKGNNTVFDKSDKPYIWLQIQDAQNIYELIDFIKTLTETYLNADCIQGTSHKTNRIKEYINKNYCNHDLTMDEIATHLNYSPNYISNLFKKETGITLIEYTTNKRIEMAKKLIADTDSKLYDIAAKTGFYDANYFSTVFKKVVGISPSAYKDKISNVQSDSSQN